VARDERVPLYCGLIAAALAIDTYVWRAGLSVWFLDAVAF
jgi:type IV secretory pathway TrbD component